MLEAARMALGAEYVISVCPSEQRGEVIEAAKRLCEAAPQIRMAVSLKGASICLDDRYDAWENGFISIPYDFDLGTVEGHLRALLPSQDAAAARSNGGAASAVAPRRDGHSAVARRNQDVPRRAPRTPRPGAPRRTARSRAGVLLR